MSMENISSRDLSPKPSEYWFDPVYSVDEKGLLVHWSADPSPLQRLHTILARYLAVMYTCTFQVIMKSINCMELIIKVVDNSVDTLNVT